MMVQPLSLNDQVLSGKFEHHKDIEMNIEIHASLDMAIEPQIFLAAQALLNGEIVIFPTETVYGIAADASNEAAIEHLISIKHRPENKPFPVMVADIEMAETLAELGQAKEIATDFWPGPLTLILPAKACLTDACIHDGMIGIRCPNHPIAQGFLKLTRIPLAVPSANESGAPPATQTVEAQRLFPNRDIAFRIYQQKQTQGLPTTVLKIEPQTWTILRKGPVSAQTIRNYLPQGVTLIEQG